MLKTPVLETDRLVLRPIQEEDTLIIYDCWMKDSDVSKYMFWNASSDINKTKEFVSFELNNINNDTWFRWLIIDKSKNSIVGTCLLFYNDEDGDYDISYNLGKKYWGYGYMTEAMTRALRYAKDDLNIREIIASHADANKASEGVIKKLGFVYEKDIPFTCGDGVTYRGLQYRLKF